jgi:1-acyl-sn-glycerol-3-phosphate acyltransferase
MLPPPLIRRLVLAPLVISIATCLTVLTPLVAVLSAAFNLVRRRTGQPSPGEATPPGITRAPRDRVRRGRALRVACLALAWSAGETAALTVLLCLWIVSGFGGRLDTEPYQARHYEIMRWFLDLIYRVAQRACGLRVEVAGPPPAALGGRPLIVLCRHAGPGDSLLLIHHLLSVCERRPRVVMKATLQLDPSLDVVANRVPNAFVRRASAGPGGAGADPGRSGADPGGAGAGPGRGRGRSARQHTEQVRRLAAGLDRGGALVIFPEGGNWTPLRWRRAIDRLRRRGHDDLAERAAAMPNVLPPRTGAALAALAACPAADVIFVAHTGLDRLVSVRDVWRSLLTDMEVRARWWRVASADVPRAADRETQVRWLYDWWERVDEWITAQGAAHVTEGV